MNPSQETPAWAVEPPQDEQGLELWLDWYGRDQLEQEQQAFNDAF